MTSPMESLLDGRTILVVEDDFFLAQEIARELQRHGVTILGPVATVADALALLETVTSLDGAVLDVNLLGEMVYPIADVLKMQGTPFLFVTGYHATDLPAAYHGVICFQKPIDADMIASALFGSSAS